MTEKIKRAVDKLEESLGLHEMLRVKVTIVFASPTDGSRSAPMTLEQIQEQRKGVEHGE